MILLAQAMPEGSLLIRDAAAVLRRRRIAI